MTKPDNANIYGIYRLDFSTYAQRSFAQLNPGVVLHWNWHLDLIVDRILAFDRGEIKRLIITLPPRSLKSHLVSVAYPAWLLGNKPSSKLICVSYAKGLADDLSRQCRTLMESDFHKKTFSTRLLANRKAVEEFATTKLGYRLATSVGGTLTGRGADILLLDDIMKPDEAASDSMRKATKVWYRDTLLSRLNDKKEGRILVIMQRLHQDDLIADLLAQGDWEVLCLPAIATEDEEHFYTTVAGQQHKIRKAGEALHPEREPLETLEQLKRNMGTLAFSTQYQQAPLPLEGNMIKEGWFRFYDPANPPGPFDFVYQSWDTASKSNDLSDHSVCTTWGVKGPYIYLLHVYRERVDYPDLKRAVKTQAALFNPKVILIEDKGSGISLIQELIKERVYGIEAYQPKGEKIMRLNDQSAIIEAGFVFLPREAAWLEEYISELTGFPNTKYDDQADSTSQALHWINDKNRVPHLTQYYQEGNERRQNRKKPSIRLVVPPEISHVYLMDGTQVSVPPDRIITVSEENAPGLLRLQWKRLE